MPAKSIAQQHLMQAAEHGADFPMAKKVQSSMSHDQMHDFAVGSEADKPVHVLKGNRPDIMGINRKAFKAAGMSEADAMTSAIKTSKKGHPDRAKNLKNFLHPKKGN